MRIVIGPDDRRHRDLVATHCLDHVAEDRKAGRHRQRRREAGSGGDKRGGGKGEGDDLHGRLLN